MKISFFSKSKEIYQSLPGEVSQSWDVFLLSPEGRENQVDILKTSSLIIVDTYTLSMEFLYSVMDKFIGDQCPVLVLGQYTEKLFIDNILSRGAKGYLLVDAFEEELYEAINHLLNGGDYISTLLEAYKGNTYLSK